MNASISLDEIDELMGTADSRNPSRFLMVLIVLLLLLGVAANSGLMQ